MSVEASTWAWRQPVKGNAKLVLLALADHADRDGMCWPGQAGIADKCGITDRAVRDQMRVLEDGDLIVREARYRPGGGRTSDLILLAMDGPSKPEDSSGKPASKPEDFVIPNRNTASGLKRKDASGEPSIEPSEEPVAPSELVGQVHRALCSTAALRSLAPPSCAAVAQAVSDFPDRDHLAVAGDLDYWARHGNGASRKSMAIGNTYRNFLKRAEPKAAATAAASSDAADQWVAENLGDIPTDHRRAATSWVRFNWRAGDRPTAGDVRSYLDRSYGGSEG